MSGITQEKKETRMECKLEWKSIVHFVLYDVPLETV